MLLSQYNVIWHLSEVIIKENTTQSSSMPAFISSCIPSETLKVQCGISPSSGTGGNYTNTVNEPSMPSFSSCSPKLILICCYVCFPFCSGQLANAGKLPQTQVEKHQYTAK